MRYVSTRGNTAPMPFKEALITGLAPDGGLLVPEHFPDVSSHLETWRQLDYVELAKRVVRLFVDDFDEHQLDELVEKAYASFDNPNVVELRTVGAVNVLELFHGPTLAFKDVALQLLGQMFEPVLAERGQHLNIVGATSGDTGSAAIAGVRGQQRVDIFIMFPKGRVSPLQELQMTSVLDANVHCLSVRGSFDDCQSMMKSCFSDLEFKAKYSLGAVNSVNWARVLAQIVYYAYASLQFGSHSKVNFVVPTGNFGNVFAGYVARQMGFPIGTLLVATNENDILARFFATGEYRRDEVKFTVTPAMDIQVASNFERYLYYHMGKDCDELRSFMSEFANTGRARVEFAPGADGFEAISIPARDTLEAIRSIHDQFDYIADPHTAVGLCAAAKLDLRGPVVCVATAHPAKFPESVDEALGQPLARHQRLEALRDKPHRSEEIAADISALQDYVAKHARS